MQGTNQPNHGKLFVADENGVRLFRSRDEIDPAPPNYNSPTCILGAYYAFSRTEITADGGTIAALGYRASAGYCSLFRWATLLISATGDRELPGYVRISPGGRYAIADVSVGAFSIAQAKLLDLQTGSETRVSLPGVPAQGGAIDFLSGRTVADNGTALFNFWG